MKKTIFQTLLIICFTPILAFGQYADNCCGCGITADVDYLYWNTCRSNLDYYSLLLEGTNNTPFLSEYFSLGNDWSSGVRATVGYCFCDCLELSARYTYYESNISDQINNGQDNGVGTRPNNSGSELNLLTSANGSYKLDYNVLDIELAGGEQILCKAVLAPFVGVRFGWIHEKIDVFYTALDNVQPIQKVDLNSYGVVIGSDYLYNLCGCFNLMGRLSIGAHYGDFDWRTQEITDADIATPVTGFGTNCRAIYTAEIAISLVYEGSFCNCNWNLGVGYEFQPWLSMLDFQNLDGRNAIPSYNTATLLLHGLHVRLGVGF